MQTIQLAYAGTLDLPAMSPLHAIALTVTPQKSSFKLGRAADNDAVMYHGDLIATAKAAVSRYHAEIAYEGGRWWLSDTGSTNGTFILHTDNNGVESFVRLEKGRRVELVHGSRLNIGGGTAEVLHRFFVYDVVAAPGPQRKELDESNVSPSVPSVGSATLAGSKRSYAAAMRAEEGKGSADKSSKLARVALQNADAASRTEAPAASVATAVPAISAVSAAPPSAGGSGTSSTALAHAPSPKQPSRSSPHGSQQALEDSYRTLCNLSAHLVCPLHRDGGQHYLSTAVATAACKCAFCYSCLHAAIDYQVGADAAAAIRCPQCGETILQASVVAAVLSNAQLPPADALMRVIAVPVPLLDALVSSLTEIPTRLTADVTPTTAACASALLAIQRRTSEPEEHPRLPPSGPAVALAQALLLSAARLANPAEMMGER
jgi:pSer/pThr/pTyr-binding forkhead associated (FHA) protein